LAAADWVLDLGCGEGRHVHGVAMIDGVNVVGLDADGPSLTKGRDGLAQLPPRAPNAVAGFVRGDAFRLPFDDGAFDAVICSEVLEHLSDDWAALVEARRVLKPGGRLALTVPRAWPERLCWALADGPGGYADQPGGHVRIFREAALRRAVTSLGFTYRGRHHAHALHTPYWWLKTALWRRRDDHPLIRIYHRFLVWDLMDRPMLTRAMEAVAAPALGKSLALYFVKSAA